MRDEKGCLMKLSEEEKWDAVVRCDTSLNGMFFYGVKTTKIFCRPSCPSKQPLRRNVAFFDAVEEACAHGFRPCKRCRPDLPDYQPMAGLLEQIKGIFDTYFDDSEQLEQKIQELNISQNHLIRSFYARYGVTPVGYINRLRVEKAVSLLQNSQSNILKIALACGFGSLSMFYECFKRQVGLTPGEYRNRNVQTE